MAKLDLAAMAKLDLDAMAKLDLDAMAKLDQGAMAKHGANGPDWPNELNAVRRHAAPRCRRAVTIRQAKPPAAVGNSLLARRD